LPWGETQSERRDREPARGPHLPSPWRSASSPRPRSSASSLRRSPRRGRSSTASRAVPRYPRPMDEPSRDAILAALANVIDPELQRPVTELDMVRGIEIEDGMVSLTIVLTVAGCPLRDSFERQVDQALTPVPGVRGFSLSFAVMTPEERQALTTKLRGGAPERDNVVRLPRDCRVIAVASGQGGV